MTGLHEVEVVLLLLLVFVVGFGSLAQRLNTPYPIVLVVAGLLLSPIPHLPRFILDPDIVFVLILPPLLFSAAFNTSWRDFRHHIVTILLLAFGLVAFTAIGIAGIAHWLLPNFDWRLGLALGAIVSPTDPVAASTIARRLRLPTRITEVLEGESLVNDASGLLLLQLAIAAVANGSTPSVGYEAAKLVYMVGAGIGVGLLFGVAVYQFETWIDNGPIEITLSFVTPYLAYLAAEEVHSSGILAVVACGLYLGRHSSHYYSSMVRIQAWSTWNTLTFVLNGIVFVMIGLQLRYILGGIKSVGLGDLFFSAAVTVVVVVLLRVIWVYPAAYISHLVRLHFLGQTDAKFSPREIFIVGWTGMRGVVALAAAISLPRFLDGGQPFPQRNVIIFVTFCVIFVTLVVQGLTLPATIRGLGLSGSAETVNEEEREARRQMIEAALESLERLRAEDSNPNSAEVYEEIEQQYQRRRAALGEDEHKKRHGARFLERYRQVSRKLRDVQRSMVLELRDENKISDAVRRRLERELDLLDVRYQHRG